MTGTDWKSALAALGGASDNEKEDTSINNNGINVDTEKKDKKDVNRKKRVGVVYSTNPDFGYAEEEKEKTDTLPNNQQKLRLNMERTGRGGKTVTLIKGFVGSDDDILALCKLLKQKCGVGGSVKDGEIIIQGDHRTRLVQILKNEGYTQAK